jgi:zinc transport system substrate-binding protein
MPRRLLTLSAGLALAAALAGCGSSSDAASGRVDVVAAFYPLQFATEQIGGDHVDVTGLTKPGAEPHELELTPKDVAEVSKAELVVYEHGLQPAVDEAVASQAPDTSLDVAPAARLDLALQPAVGHDHASEVEQHESGEGHDHAGATDPHFWLDPVRYRDVSRAIADRLSQVDPAHEADYRARAKAFEAKLTKLNHAFATGLAHCERPEIVTSHSAFGYLAQRYHLAQVGITGLSPDAEPDPSQIAAVTRYVQQHDVTTIYSETLVSPATADTIAQETGAKVKVLDPIEGITDKSAGNNYFEIMRANLATLESGQSCS